MKGIILAGGSGTRLYPLTQMVCKQLLPVYDKPMICYPLASLMTMGIQDILIISTPEDTPKIKEYLGNGNKLGINLSYAVQNEPKGIAEAFLIGAEFIGNDAVTLILGDNIFYLGGQISTIRDQINNSENATIFGYHVKDPERFGVIEFEKGSEKVKTLEEKPLNPRSNYAAVGLYCYPSDVVEKVQNLKPSARGELEITCLNNLYLSEGRMNAIKLKRGTAWLDAGTPEALMEAAHYMGAIESRQGLKIACLEEVAYWMNYINESELKNLVNDLPQNSGYAQYLIKILEEIRQGDTSNEIRAVA